MFRALKILPDSLPAPPWTLPVMSTVVIAPLAKIEPELAAAPPVSEPPIFSMVILPFAPPVMFSVASATSPATSSVPSRPSTLLTRLPPAACVLAPSLPRDRAVSEVRPGVAVFELPASIRPRSPSIVTAPRSRPVAFT